MLKIDPWILKNISVYVANPTKFLNQNYLIQEQPFDIERQETITIYYEKYDYYYFDLYLN